jgi:hypothetical protein
MGYRFYLICIQQHDGFQQSVFFKFPLFNNMMGSNGKLGLLPIASGGCCRLCRPDLRKGFRLFAATAQELKIKDQKALPLAGAKAFRQ